LKQPTLHTWQQHHHHRRHHLCDLWHSV